jgi:beta-glucuronidase
MLDLMPSFRIESPGKPLLVSEFGAEALQGIRAQGLELFSEEYQARLFRQQLAMLDHCPALCGLSPWILKDFRAPYRLHSRLQQYWNRKGLLSETGVRKQAFAVLAEHYQERAGRGR